MKKRNNIKLYMMAIGYVIGTGVLALLGFLAVVVFGMIIAAII